MKQKYFNNELSIYNIGHRLMQPAVLLISIAILLTVSCKENLIKAPSKEMADFTIDLSTFGGTLIRGVAHADSIKPKITFKGQTGAYFDTAAYSFIWTSFASSDTISTKSYLTYADFENQPNGVVECLLKVQDKKSGIIKYKATEVFLTTSTREGWVLLREQDGAAKLSMLTYSTDGYKKFIDLENEAGIALTLNGKPMSIGALGTELPMFFGQYQLLAVATDQEIKMLRTTDFQVDEEGSNFLSGVLQPNLPGKISFAMNGDNTFVATKNNTIYQFSNAEIYVQRFFQSQQLNTYPPGRQGAPSFKASNASMFTKSAAGSRPEYDRIMFDEDSSVFVHSYIYDQELYKGPLNIQTPFSLKGFSLIACSADMWMPEGEHVMREKSELTAFLHNRTTSESYVIQFLSNGVFKSSHKVPANIAADIVSSRFVEVDYNTGCLIYTKGNEVWGYDYKIGQSFSLLNFGTDHISLLKMEKRIPAFTRTPGRLNLYKKLFKQLVVCTYNPQLPNSSGTFRLYTLALGHQTPVLTNEETGFSKIVDATFAPLP